LLTLGVGEGDALDGGVEGGGAEGVVDAEAIASVAVPRVLAPVEVSVAPGIHKSGVLQGLKVLGAVERCPLGTKLATNWPR